MTQEARYIYVYSKDGKKLAEFSNSTAVYSDEAKANIKTEPIVHIVSNGESTLSFDILANSQKWQTIKDPENIYVCGNRQYTALNAQSIVYDGMTVHVTLVETWYLLKRVYVQAYNVDPGIEALDEHTVKILPKADAKNKLTVNGVQYDDNQVVDSRGVVMPRGSAGYALWALLKGTDWGLGVCDVLPDGFNAAEDYGTFNVESDMKSVLENIQFVQSMYGGILDWDSKNKLLSLRDESKNDSEFNRWHGFEIRKRKNLAAPPKITYDNDIITKLYPLGNGNLNIKAANDGKSYIENHSYTEAVYEGYLTNPNIYYTGDNAGRKTLKFWAERQLEKLCKPRMSIQYEIIDLRATPGFKHETFDVNHVVKAYYDDTNGKEVFEYKRIQELSYNYFFPNSDSTVVVGDKVANVTELFHQVYKKTESSAPTDQNGNLSGDNIYIEIPEFMLPDFGYDPSWGGVGYGSLSEITQLHAYYEKKNADGLTQVESGVDVLANEVKAQNESYTAFQKETTEKFTQSATTISQISDALSAQVNLEATHYKETKQSIVESNAEIRSYVDGDFAKQTLAAAYGYTDKKTQAVADSVASLMQYANNTFATISSIASFVTMGDVNGAVSRSEASIKQYADKRYASINLTARVAQTEANLNQLGGYVTVGADSVAIGAGGGHGIQITKDVISIYGNVYILNKQIYVDSKGYLRGR